MSRKSVGLALVLAGGLSAWAPPADFAQTAHDVAPPLVGDAPSTLSESDPIRAAGGYDTQSASVTVIFDTNGVVKRVGQSRTEGGGWGIQDLGT